MRLAQWSERNRSPLPVVFPLRKINCLLLLLALLAATSTLFHPTSWNDSEHAIQVVVSPSPGDPTRNGNRPSAALKETESALEKTERGKLHRNASPQSRNITTTSVSKHHMAVANKSVSKILNSTTKKGMNKKSLSKHPSIPRRLIFTHKTNLLDPQTADPSDRAFFLPNIYHTIRTYAVDLWQGRAPVHLWFLNNTECLNILQRVEPRLVSHFRREKEGKYKGDLCRMAALFLKGGYYIDVDMKAIQPIALESNTTFASVNSTQGFFNSFVASKPRHPIVYYSLQLMLRFYQNRTRDFEWKQSDMLYQTGYPPESEEELIVLEAMERIRSVGLVGPFTLAAAYEGIQWRLLNGNFSNELSTFRTSDAWSNVSRKKNIDYGRFGELLTMEDYDDENEIEEDDANADDELDESRNEGRMCFLYQYRPECSDYYSRMDEYNSQMDELWDKLDDGRSRIKPLVNFTQLLREEDFGDKRNKKSREQFPHLPYQDEGQGPNCNWVVRDDEHVYFFSRIIGTGKDHCDFPKNQSRPTRLQPDRRWPLPTNVRLFQMRERKFQRHQKISLKGRTI